MSFNLNQTYTAYYKNFDQWFWRKIKNVVQDGFIEYRMDNAIVCKDARFFELSDGRRIEISSIGTLFKFSKERAIIKTQQPKAIPVAPPMFPSV